MSTLARSTAVGLLLAMAAVTAWASAASARPAAETGARDHWLRIAAGPTGSHTCAVREDGNVVCWGQNANGQLGNGSSGLGELSREPVLVGGASGAVAVAAGSSHSCALLSSGRVRCWGGNGSGQLGLGTIGGVRTTATEVPDLTDVVAIGAGALHTCAVVVGGTLRCWGRNNSGQLGVGFISTPLPSPTLVPGLSLVVAVAGGSDHTCALRADGTASCWGANADGQLGNGGTAASTSPVLVPNFTGLVAIATGRAHSCALRAGEVFCWGDNSSQQIGRGGGGTTDQLSPSRVAPTQPLGLVVAIALGADHGCAQSRGGVSCWGENGSSQLADGSTTDRSVPVSVIERREIQFPDLVNIPLTRAHSLAAGQSHTCSLQVDDSVKCWGSNASGQLGTGDTSTPSLASSSVSGLVGTISARQVSAGSGYTCARRAGAAMACWGSNSLGQLGDGTTDDRLVPTAVSGPQAIAVQSGSGHTCALGVTSSVRCWGLNDRGQLGVGLGDLLGPTAIAVGGRHSCALEGHGAVACWGDNQFRQLGPATTAAFRSVFIRVTDLTLVTAIAAGRDHTCALRADGTVHCWGGNAFGQVGPTGSINPRATPFQVPGVTGAVAVAAGPDHSCALLAGGGARCWGKNDVGQLGNGEEDPIFPQTPTPVVVQGFSDGTALAAGGGPTFNSFLSGDFTCGRRANGTVTCWGSNAFGQLGDNSTTNHLEAETSVRIRRSFTLIGGGTTTFFLNLAAAAITAGQAHACGLQANGQPACWGNNGFGALGDGTDDSRPFALEANSFAFNVNPVVERTRRDRVVRVTALANCPDGAHVQIRITLTQGRVTGDGHANEHCTGGLERYEVKVDTHDRRGFDDGPAVAEAEAIVRDRGRVLETHEWTRAVTIVP